MWALMTGVCGRGLCSSAGPARPRNRRWQCHWHPMETIRVRAKPEGISCLPPRCFDMHAFHEVWEMVLAVWPVCPLSGGGQDSLMIPALAIVFREFGQGIILFIGLALFLPERRKPLRGLATRERRADSL